MPNASASSSVRVLARSSTVGASMNDWHRGRVLGRLSTVWVHKPPSTPSVLVVGQAKRVQTGHRLHVEQLRGLGIGHDGFAREALDQGARYAGVHRGDQADPEGGEAGGEK